MSKMRFHRAKYTTAILVAAGSSQRMGAGVSKILLPVCGIPVIVHTMLAYQEAKTVDEIVLVAKPEEFETFIALARDYHITKLVRITSGGDSRQESVLRGVNAVSPKTRYIAIADGARCLVTPKMINAVNRTAYRTQAASAGTPSIDTVKVVNFSRRVISTPDRNAIWRAATPQTFALDLYRSAAYFARKKKFNATDDNSIIEWIGKTVTMVDTGNENIKITLPQDIRIAEAILQYRKDTGKNEKCNTEAETKKK